jgi:hypothetical protein
MKARTVRSYARHMMALFPGLVGWKVEIKRLPENVSGYCDVPTSGIWIGTRHIMRDHRNQVLNTVRHELVHALVPDDLEYGPKFAAGCALLGVDFDSPASARLIRSEKHRTRENR